MQLLMYTIMTLLCSNGRHLLNHPTCPIIIVHLVCLVCEWHKFTCVHVFQVKDTIMYNNGYYYVAAELMLHTEMKNILCVCYYMYEGKVCCHAWL